VDGMVEATRESTEDQNVVLYLKFDLAEPSGIGRCGAYPVRLALKVGDTGNAFHEVGRVLVPILDDGNALHGQYSLRNTPGVLQTYL
jgi:hypothetical protein